MPTRYEWQELRDFVRSTAEGDLKQLYPDLRLAAIDFAAGHAAQAWRGPDRRAEWDWTAVLKRPAPNRFDVAIWNAERLCALAYGPADDTAVAIEYLEADPDPSHPLKGQVFKIAAATLEAQARIVDVRLVRLLGPKPALVTYYQSFGYGPPVKPIGCIALEKELKAEA
ncbi:hypothetical protein [Methylobacterium oxalidis]|uniref:hypothetical protein n=1 Tax=Methylobacterium oxalidis TaxID=944322 RepID=UPI0033157509